MAQRLDKWLVYARFCKHRSTACTWIAEGQVRLNKVRVAKPSACVKAGDVLTLAGHGEVRVITVRAEAARRGPPAEARLLYDESPDAAAPGLPDRQMSLA